MTDPQTHIDSADSTGTRTGIHSRRDQLIQGLILLAGAVLLYIGWRLFWFLTDDAYISFRYVSNSQLGFGYVWNPPPFQPVEGYTSFLWVLLLDICWRVFDTPPPQAANWISLGFSFLTLCTSFFMLIRIRWTEKLGKYRFVFAALLVLYLVTNRTFLAWSSSGLETAMFNFFVTLWVFSCVSMNRNDTRRLAVLCLSAAAIYLSRPDGMLFAAATVIIATHSLVSKKRHLQTRSWLTLIPLLVIPLHLLWRHARYGAWLPNTYYAKYVEPWPESGARYAASFILEYALWIWIAVMAWGWFNWLFSEARRNTESGSPLSGKIHFWKAIGDNQLIDPIIMMAVLFVHWAYYTFIIGGDHFEYRVYSHLLPLAFISFAWVINSMRLKLPAASCLACALLLFSLPVPWTHWAATRNIFRMKDTYYLYVPIEDRWPAIAGWYARAFDRQQAWLIKHLVCERHQKHKLFHLGMTGSCPPRSAGMTVSNHGFPVLAARSVGVLSWCFPRVNIIDHFGLNDRIVARTPVPKSRERLMAHERHPPGGYVESFSPNVRTEQKEPVVDKRETPLTEKDILRIEEEWAGRIK